MAFLRKLSRSCSRLSGGVNEEGKIVSFKLDGSTVESTPTTMSTSFDDVDLLRQVSNDAHFPMYVISVENLLTLDKLPMHEELMDRGMLEEVTGSHQHVHFISQCWLSFEHPDPDGVKLRRFQSVCTEIQEGDPRCLFDQQDWEAFANGSSRAKTFGALSTELSADSQGLQPETFQRDVYQGYVWWDYISVPQMKTENAVEMQALAITSIPHYIERCSYFWVNAAEARHSDTQELVNYETWQSRGWCRLEEWGNFLALRMAPSLVLTSGPHLGVVDTMDFLALRSGAGGLARHAVCQGTFSCCCMGHERVLDDGTSVPIRCDKEYVGTVITKMFDNKLRHYKATGKAFMHRFLKNSVYSVLAGTGGAAVPESLDELYEECGLCHPCDNYQGLTPLSWACSHGSQKLVQDLLNVGARADQSVTILQMASQRGDVEVLTMLLDSGTVSVEAIDKGSPKANITPLDRAAKSGHYASCQLLLAYGASPHPVRNDNGQTPLHTAAEGGYPDIVSLLLDAGAIMDVGDALGRTPFMLAAQRFTLFGRSNGKVQCALNLLAARAEPNIPDANGRLPRDVASSEGHAGFLEILDKYEAMRLVAEATQEDVCEPQRDVCGPQRYHRHAGHNARVFKRVSL